MGIQLEAAQQKELCPKCLKAKASTRKSKLCQTCHTKWQLSQAKQQAVLSPDLIAKVGLAKTTEDWQKLAAELAPIIAAILSGEVKATAAQASLLKDIQNRAYGKPVATQTEKRIAAGVVILPTLNSDDKMTFACPKCGYDPTKDSLEA